MNIMKPKKIILIIIDTLRADHLGCYGYKRNTSPNIDDGERDCFTTNLHEIKELEEND